MSLDNPVLVLPKIKIHNANALSSPYTIGFPAMTAWLGAAHALQRKLNQQAGFEQLRFIGLAVASHEFDLQTYRGDRDFVNSIIGTANPVDKDGNRPAFIEEARCHLTVSLALEFEGLELWQDEDLQAKALRTLQAGMKLAGGDILTCQQPQSHRDQALLARALMPGYVLIERRDLMVRAMEQGQDALDALLDYCAIHHSCERHDDNVVWKSQRKTLDDQSSTGWIVPIATGFQGISELGSAKNQRDADTPHRFAESVVTLGQFRLPLGLGPQDLFWRYAYYPETDLYLCEQDNEVTTQIDNEDFDF